MAALSGVVAARSSAHHRMKRLPYLDKERPESVLFQLSSRHDILQENTPCDEYKSNAHAGKHGACGRPRAGRLCQRAGTRTGCRNAGAPISPSWIGFYAGGEPGYANVESDLPGVDGEDVIGGLLLGYDYDLGNDWVIGGGLDCFSPK